MKPVLFVRTQDSIMMSLSPPWKASTVDTSTDFVSFWLQFLLERECIIHVLVIYVKMCGAHGSEVIGVRPETQKDTGSSPAVVSWCVLYP